MKFKVKKKDFHTAIQNLIGVVPPKTTIPILSNLLLELEGNTLSLLGTDLEVSVSTRLEVQGDKNGSVAVPAKILFEIVRELPEIAIEFVCDEENKVTLNTPKGFYRLSGEAKEDFPRIQIDDDQIAFSIDAEKFSEMIDKTIFAVSSDELRTTLMGVFLKTIENELRMVATDGHRLVKIVDKGFAKNIPQGEAIIPTKALNLLTKNLQNTKEIKVKLNDDHIVFKLDNSTIYSKTIDGQFPNYERVIPIDNDKRLIVNRELIVAAIRRVAIFSNSITHQVRLSLSKNLVKIQSEDIEFGGEALESIEADYAGEDLEIGYNANYLLDILRHLDTDEVHFQIKDPISAGIIYPGVQKDHQEVLMLLMPIRLNED
jgi:DNA polymerase-3 subunit beta